LARNCIWSREKLKCLREEKEEDADDGNESQFHYLTAQYKGHVIGQLVTPIVLKPSGLWFETRAGSVTADGFLTVILFLLSLNSPAM
jgi:hypothetical protein